MHTDKHFYAVIMAGGGGTRLWPLSRKTSPKQMLHLFDGKTLFQIALDRLKDFFNPNQIYIVTVADQVKRLSGLAPHLPEANFLIEPMPRGTASVVAMAAAAIQKKDPEAVIVILTADHFIQNVPLFQKMLTSAFDLAKTGVLVTLGIQPSFPATGYGYIENGEVIGVFHGQKAFHVNAYIEKPSETRATEFLRDGRYSWNSGMFIWKVDVILNEFKKHMPDLYGTISKLDKYLGIDHSNPAFVEQWSLIKPETIDYGIMEKSDRAAVLPAEDLGWDDVGSWDSLFDVLTPDKQGNIVLNAKHISMETHDSLVYSSTDSKLIVTLGMTNMIVIDTPDAILICPRGESQKVKDLVNYLRDNQYTPYL
jgi:mannose-1-phosphate guanylyltransferase